MPAVRRTRSDAARHLTGHDGRPAHWPVLQVGQDENIHQQVLVQDVQEERAHSSAVRRVPSEFLPAPPALEWPRMRSDEGASSSDRVSNTARLPLAYACINDLTNSIVHSTKVSLRLLETALLKTNPHHHRPPLVMRNPFKATWPKTRRSPMRWRVPSRSWTRRTTGIIGAITNRRRRPPVSALEQPQPLLAAVQAKTSVCCLSLSHVDA